MWLWCLLATLAVAAVAGLLVGAGISLGEAWSGLTAWATGSEADPLVRSVILGIRAPRVAAALVVGFGLGVAGLGFQSLFRNPVADPYLMGLSTSAGLGVVLATLLLPGGDHPALRFVGAALVCVLTALVVRRIHENTDGGPGFVLVGVAIGMSFLALTLVVIFASSNPRLPTFAYFVFGGLAVADWPSVALCLVVVAVAGAVLFRNRRSLDLLSLGAPAAMTLGVDVRRLSSRVAVAGGAIVGATVAIAGVIGFVGLLAPHLARRVLGRSDPLALLAAGLFGSLVLVAADVGIRALSGTVEIPIGVATAAVGGPTLVFLLLRRRWV